MRTYQYIGPVDLLELVKTVSKGDRISSSQDIMQWIEETNQNLDAENRIIATYIIDLNGNLLIADRHSEHVVCAGGENVLSAGEITFKVKGLEVKVVEVTNQSTGYCPEPESWPSVKAALENASLYAPVSFAREFIFRRCEKCGLLNIVKEEWFVCVKCEENLNKLWNIN